MSKKNFIPIKSDTPTNNYYCTWNTQNFGRYDAKSETDRKVFCDGDGAKKARAFLNEEHLIGNNGLLNQYSAIRSELWFLLDDGWDVPYGIHPDENIRSFGSLEVSVERFPSCSGTPSERLLKLNGIVKNAGWKGLGIWVASQAKGETWGDTLSFVQSEEYWKQRLIWSNEAGVGYWKIDWGCRQYDNEWNLMIERLAKEYAPNLILEHSHPSSPPVNNVDFSDDNQVTDGRFSSCNSIINNWVERAKFSPIFRTYDVLAQLSQITTIDRVAVLLRELKGSNCILNCEDEVYAAAALGLTMGIMRSGFNKKIPIFNFDPQNVSNRLIEVERAVRWQRIAPAFSVGEYEVCISDETVSDKYHFNEGDTWLGDAIGKEISQSCPAVVSRGIKPDRIIYKEDKKPIFLASKNKNGAISVAALPRCISRDVYKTPLCTPVFSNIENNTDIGIFGYFDSLIFKFKESVDEYSVWIQDLSKDEAVCVDGQIITENNRLEISGDLINKICACFDDSEPGALLKLIKKN